MFDNRENSEADLLDQVLDSAQTGLFLIDSKGLIIYCNPLVSKFTETSAPQFIGQPYTALLDQIAQLSSDLQQTLRDVAAALRYLEQPQSRSKLPVPHQFYLSTSGTSARRLQVRLFPAAAQRSWAWTGTIQEVNQESNMVTQQAQYLSRVIKELRISFAEITGSIAPLLENHTQWEVDERHHFLQSFSMRLDLQKRILENAHDLFKLELGEWNVNKRLIAVKTLLEQAIHNLNVKRDGCQVDITLPNDFPLILISPSVGERIFRNILNAVFRSTPIDCTLQIGGTSGPDEADVSIHCPGVAFNNHELKHLFESFSLTTSGGRDMPGSGLELFAAQQFILAQGGRFWAEYTDQAGTTFHCVFSLNEQPAQPVKPPLSVAKAKSGKPKRAKNSAATVRAMIVEDDHHMAEMLKMMLAKAGYPATVASSAQHALEMIYDDPPEFVLLDLHMPGMDGFALASQLRQELPIPIIALTADSRRETRMRALSLGVDDYLTKPVDFDELMARIRNILQRASGRVIGQPNPGIHLGSLHIDVDRRETTVNGQPIKLAPTEFKLLHVLARNADRTLTYDQLLKAVWGPQYRDEKQYLWVHINRLRRKLSVTTSHTDFIVTEPGVGYRLSCPAEA